MKTLLSPKLIACTVASFMLIVGGNALAAETRQLISGTQISVTDCKPTPADYLGPFYEPNAPVRAIVGKGHNLEGVVQSTIDCTPIAKVRIELWLARPDGSYDDNHRATIFTDEYGRYRFESNIPRGYFGRPPHIHMRISAPGFKTLTTQHYPEEGQVSGKFDIVLVPIN